MPHQANWNVYLKRGKAGISAVTVDIGWASEGRDTGLPTLMVIRLVSRDQSRGGLPSAQEVQSLTTLEDAAIDLICVNDEVVHMGAIQSGQTRDVIFYAPKGYRPADRSLAHIPPDRRAQPFLILEDDPEWRLYQDVMFPSPEEHRRMMDDQVLRTLAENGDDHSIPRPVDHYVYFNDPARRSAFVEWCKRSGLRVERLIDPDPQHPRTGVVFSQITAVSPDIIHEIIAHMVKAAAHYGGDYDGWETRVAKHT